MNHLIKITDGKKILEVTQRAFDVIYQTHGYVMYEEKAEEIKPKRTRAKKTNETEEAK